MARTVQATNVQRLVKALEMQIAYQREHPTTNKRGDTNDPTRVPFFAKFTATSMSFPDAVRKALELDKTGYQKLVLEATDAAVVVNAWADPGRCLTLPQYVGTPNGPVPRINAADTAEIA